MLADFMSKPLQGMLFKLFRSVIMGWEHISILFNLRPSIEERVEDSSIEKSEAILAIDDSGHKKIKMTYSEATRCRSNVLAQNEKILLGIHPADNE